MAINENQLETWSHQGAIQQSAATYDIIRRVLIDPRAPYASHDFTIFLQGSYGNSTNIWRDSDVDIVICLTSIFYSDTNQLTEEERGRYEAGRVPGQYSFDQFKNEVTSWLRANFGSGVTPGNKAIFVPGSNNRRDADVLVCVENHDYYAYPANCRPSYHEGICFWTTRGDKIVNYPKQHMANCTTKHGGTANRFKPTIRVAKNMRNAMVEASYIADGVAPSYFIEGMLYNVPSGNFVWNFQQIVENALAWLEKCDPSTLVCANDRYYLIRDGSHVCWNMKDFQTTLSSLRRFWNSSGR